MPTQSGSSLREALTSATWRGALLTVGGLAAAFAYNGLRTDGIPWRSYDAPTTCGGEASRPEVGVVTPEALSVDCASRDIVVADARPAERFKLGHIAGAVHLPCTASADAARVVDSLLHGKQDLVVYGDSEAEARRVAETLATRAGEQVRVRVLAPGFEAWANRGLACASGACECPGSEHRHDGEHP